MKNIKSVFAWAWLCDFDENEDWVLCFWCCATKNQLIGGGKPTPKSKAIRIKMSVARGVKKL